MTKRQRVQVAELLRCAADNLSPISTGAWTDATEGVGPSCAVELLAHEAFHDVRGARAILDDGSDVDVELGRWTYLEAALRVEQGEWP